jgi:uncharacterized repeat protein (TIGR03843 family)
MEPEVFLGDYSRAQIEEAALSGRQLAVGLSDSDALELLASGELTVVGRLLTASNGTFFAVVSGALASGLSAATETVASCVYKPTRGEQPLWDFPDGTLACREVASYLLSEASGWRLIPPTILRDGPFGPGMVQLWVESDDSVMPDQLLASHPPELRRIAVLDAVLNNADRKGGHLLPLRDGRIMGVDNGLCFSVEPKLRTVLWHWRGKPLADEEVAMLSALRDKLAGSLGDELRTLLDDDEVLCTAKRIDHLLETRRLPRPDRDRPAIPWPPY